MFRKVLKVITIVLGSVTGFVAVVILALQVLLNSRVATNLVHKVASENIDADLSFSDLHVSLIRNFPHVRVTVDSLLLTNPGDTLAGFRRFTASVNVWQYLSGIIRLDDASIDGLALLVHQYDSTSSNWNVFKQSEEQNEDTTSVNLPLISIGEVALRGVRAKYLSDSDNLSASVSLDSFRLVGDVTVENDVASSEMFASMEGLSADARLGDFGLVHAVLDASSKVRVLQEGDSFEIGYAEADASVDIDADGIVVSLTGGASDIFGEDPAFRAKGFADLDLEKACRFVPEDAGIDASGKARLVLDGKATMSQIMEYTADLEARLSSDTLSVRIGDALALAVRALNVSLENSSASIAGSSFHPLEGRLDMDRVRFRTDSMSVAAAGMKNGFSIAKGEYRGKTVPCISLENGTSRLMFRSGTTRAAVKDVSITASLIKRVRPSRSQHMRKERTSDRETPVYLSEKDWKSKDISIALDTSVTRYLREWSPSGSISVGRGIVAVPELPLRNRLAGLEASFTDNDVDLERLSIESGTSDVLACGKLSGLRRFLTRGGTLKASLDVSSSRINATEILSALKAGQSIVVDESEESDENSYMESFVVDSLPETDSSTDSMGLFVVPANIDATFNLKVGKVDWTGIDIKGLKASATMRERCAQITDAEVDTDAGKIALDAFYSTRTKKDISAGFDLNLSDVSADRIISLVPSVDDMMPALKSFKGHLNCQLTATTQLDTMMNIVMPSLDGVLKIYGKDLRVEDAGDLRKITRLLMFKNKNIGDIEDLDVSAFVHDNKVEVFPFIIGVDRYRLALCGMQGFDNSLNYHVSILKTPLPIRFGLNLYGTFDDWKFSLGRAKYRDGKVPAFTQQIDTMQVNIAKSIRQIYRRGVKAALKQNSNSFESVEQYKKSIGYRTPDGEEEFLTIEEYCQIDSIQFEMDIAEIEAQVMEEVDQILDETFVSAEALSKEFDKMFFDKRLLRQQERSARRDARKSERKAGKSA